MLIDPEALVEWVDDLVAALGLESASPSPR